MPIFVFLGLSVLELRPMYTTDRCQTKALLNAPPIRGGGIISSRVFIYARGLEYRYSCTSWCVLCVCFWS